MMKAPWFWHEISWVAKILYPFSLIYSFFVERRLKEESIKTPLPLICVGNVVAGGAGKTPIAISLAILLKKEGYTPCFLSRGYGGSIEKPTKVDVTCHNCQSVGDEPLLLAKIAPTWIAKNRKQGMQSILQESLYDVVIMDDGYQNPSFLKSRINLLVIDGGYGLGNGYVIPAGPLREPFSKALKRAHGVIIIGADIKNLSSQIPKDIPLFKAHLRAKGKKFQGQKVFGFCGIGRPDKFFVSLTQAEAIIVGRKDFPDHHVYTQRELRSLLDKAKQKGALLVTTQKDYVRLPTWILKEVSFLPVDIQWGNTQKRNKSLKENQGTLPRHKEGFTENDKKIKQFLHQKL